MKPSNVSNAPFLAFCTTTHYTTVHRPLHAKKRNNSTLHNKICLAQKFSKNHHNRIRWYMSTTWPFVNGANTVKLKHSNWSIETFKLVHWNIQTGPLKHSNWSTVVFFSPQECNSVSTWPSSAHLPTASPSTPPPPAWSQTAPLRHLFGTIARAGKLSQISASGTSFFVLPFLQIRFGRADFPPQPSQNGLKVPIKMNRKKIFHNTLSRKLSRKRRIRCRCNFHGATKSRILKFFSAKLEKFSIGFHDTESVDAEKSSKILVKMAGKHDEEVADDDDDDNDGG